MALHETGCADSLCWDDPVTVSEARLVGGWGGERVWVVVKAPWSWCWPVCDWYNSGHSRGLLPLTHASSLQGPPLKGCTPPLCNVGELLVVNIQQTGPTRVREEALPAL